MLHVYETQHGNIVERAELWNQRNLGLRTSFCGVLFITFCDMFYSQSPVFPICQIEIAMPTFSEDRQ